MPWLAALLSGKIWCPVYRRLGGTRLVWIGAENLTPIGITTLNIPACRESLYWLYYRSHHRSVWHFNIILHKFKILVKNVVRHNKKEMMSHLMYVAVGKITHSCICICISLTSLFFPAVAVARVAPVTCFTGAPSQFWKQTSSVMASSCCWSITALFFNL